MASLMNEASSPKKGKTVGLERLFHHSNKKVKMHRSASSGLTCCLLPLWQVIRHTYFVEMQKTTAAAITGQGWGSLFIWAKPLLLQNIKTERAQRIADDVTPRTWSTTSANLFLSFLESSDLLQMHKNARPVREHFFPPIIPQLLQWTWNIYHAAYLMPTVANLTPWNFLLLEKKLSADLKQKQFFLMSKANRLN